MNVLCENEYHPELSDVCWMQGESDISEEKAKNYYDNQVAFVSYLRNDLRKYTKSGDNAVYFIDAGISSIPYCETRVSDSKRSQAKIFRVIRQKYIFFSTIDIGFTTMNEPDYDPDLGHYDALYEFLLGQKFGKEIVNIYSANIIQPKENNHETNK